MAKDNEYSDNLRDVLENKIFVSIKLDKMKEFKTLATLLDVHF